MNHKKYLEFVASFIIVLVLTLPFYTTSVYAGINSISAKGSDGIDGFVKRPDYMDVTARVTSDDGSAIAPSQLKLGETPFSQCIALTEVYECTVRWPSSGTYAFNSGIQEYEVKFTENGDSTSQIRNVLVDGIAPQVTATTPKSLYSRQEEITIDYDVTDYACNDAACSNKCSGIKKIEFFTLSGTSENILETVEPTTNNCNVKNKVTIDLASPGTSASFSDGDNSIYVRATDKFDQATVKPVEFVVDLSVPSVNTNTFSISRKNVILNSYSSNAITVDASVTVTETGLTLNSVWGNFTNLSTNNAPENIQKAVCAQIGTTNNYRCSWQGLQFNPDSNSIKVMINASDNSGNKIIVPITRTLALDNNGPVLQSLATDNVANNQVFGKPTGNKVIATFDEVTGIAIDEVFLYVGNTKINSADSCAKQGTKWICEWNSIDFGTASTTMSIRADTTDVLLNTVQQEKTVDVIVDTQKPILVGDVYLQPISNPAIPGIFRIGDYIYVEANVTDENPVTARADFSDFIAGASNEDGDCGLVDNKYKCTWGGIGNSVGPIEISVDGKIKLTFTDAGGNQLPKEIDLTTLGFDGNPSPDFWKSTFRCSPRSSVGGGNATIDRSTANLINQVVYCIVTLTKNDEDDDVSTVAVFQGEDDLCVTDGDVFDEGIFNDPATDILNNEVNSTSPVLRIELSKDGNYVIDDAPLECPISILSKVKQTDGTYKITQNNEIENIKINISFYNLPLGELSESVKDMIHDAKKRALDDLKFIGQLNNLVNVAKRICQTIAIIYSITQVLITVNIFKKQAEKICRELGGDAIGVCEPMTIQNIQECGRNEGGLGRANEQKKLANKFCDFATCRQTPAWGDNVQDWINNFPLAGYFGQTTTERERQAQQGQQPPQDRRVRNYLTEDWIGARQLSQYMNPNDNLVVATLFACIPGIIGNLEKYRQIQCMYADCLENGVGKEGLPLTACKDQKKYATCKYVWGEVFSIFPWVAVFDHFTGIIKEALSNPFTALGVGITILCKPSCDIPSPPGEKLYPICRVLKLSSLVGDAAQNVALLSYEGFKIRNDYCSRLSLDEESLDEEEEEPTQQNT